MHDMPTRKERQFDKLLKTANNGFFETNMRLYKGEAKYWANRGLIVEGPNKGCVNPKIHLVSWAYPQLMDYPECIEYVFNDGMMPEEFNDGQRLFLIATKAKENKNTQNQN